MTSTNHTTWLRAVFLQFNSALLMPPADIPSPPEQAAPLRFPVDLPAPALAQDTVYVVAAVNLAYWPLFAILRSAKVWESRRWERINAIIQYTSIVPGSDGVCAFMLKCNCQDNGAFDWVRDELVRQQVDISPLPGCATGQVWCLVACSPPVTQLQALALAQLASGSAPVSLTTLFCNPPSRPHDCTYGALLQVLAFWPLVRLFPVRGTHDAYVITISISDFQLTEHSHDMNQEHIHMNRMVHQCILTAGILSAMQNAMRGHASCDSVHMPGRGCPQSVLLAPAAEVVEFDTGAVDIVAPCAALSAVAVGGHGAGDQAPPLDGPVPEFHAFSHTVAPGAALSTAAVDDHEARDQAPPIHGLASSLNPEFRTFYRQAWVLQVKKCQELRAL